MSVREYIGARYVPIFADPIEWNGSLVYEPLTVVKYQGASYVSRKSVPEGIAIDNDDYWILWADYNAQLQHYIDIVNTFDGRIDDVEDALPIADFSAQNTVYDRFSALESLLPIADFSAQNTVDDRFSALENRFPIATADIDDSSITTAKVMNGAITLDKLSNSVQRIFDYVVYPEDYGAIGDGTTDDTSAFQDMFDTISDRTVIKLRPNAVYRITNGLTLQRNEIAMICDAEFEMVPGLLFDTNSNVGLLVTGYSFSAMNVHFGGRSDSHSITLLKLDRDNASADGNIDSYIKYCTFSSAYIMLSVAGRNVKIISNLFSQSTGSAIVIEQPQAITTAMRGYVIEGNRFHDISWPISNNITAYNIEGCSVYIFGNYSDGGNGFYAGTTDNVSIIGNYISRIKIGTTAVINLTRTIDNKTSCIIADNHVNAVQSYTGEYPRTFIVAAALATGVISVVSNTFNTRFAQNGDVIIIGDSGSTKRILNIVGNALINHDHTGNLSVQSGSNSTYGIVSNNILNGTVSAGSNVTTANNVNISSGL